MDHRGRMYAAVAGTIGLFLIVQLGALALVAPFEAAGFQAVENPSDPANSVLYLGVILVATGFFLLAIKLDVTWLIRGLIVLSCGAIALYVFSVLVPPLLVASVGGAAVNVLAVGGAAGLALALWVYPEWYVIDAVGVVMGAGAAGIFGISFGLLPAIVILGVLAVYDAISVYGTEHMLTLAEGVMAMNVPVVLVVPLTLSYSSLDTGAGDEDGEPTPAPETEAWVKNDPETLGVDSDATVKANGGESLDGRAGETAEGIDGDGSSADADGAVDSDGTATLDDAGGTDESEPADDTRDAFFIGLGDAVMPTVMVASAAFFAPAPSLSLPVIALNLPALTALIGILCGLVVLMWMVLNGRAHAGLPLLNGGAIGGYLVGAIASGIPIVQALGLGPYL